MYQRLIPTGERSGLVTHIGTTESVSLCKPMKRWLRAQEDHAKWFRVLHVCLHP